MAEHLAPPSPARATTMTAPVPGPAVRRGSPGGLDLGPAPVVDFDGTIARLRVDWAELRTRLGVHSIDDLWPGNAIAWELVAADETAAADRAEPIDAVVDALRRTTTFAVLTNNGAGAVKRFFARHPDLHTKLAVVIGREQLGGPKTDFSRFRSGFAACVAATAAQRGPEAIVYAGDQDYELAFARHLGAHTVDVTSRLASP